MVITALRHSPTTAKGYRRVLNRTAAVLKPADTRSITRAVRWLQYFCYTHNIMKKTDAELVKNAKQNKEEFDALYKRYIEKIYNYFWYRVGHDQDVAEDLAQETFVRAYQALPQFKVTKKSYLSYLLTIAHNLLVNYYRSPKPISIEATGVDVPEEIWSTIETKDNIRSMWRAVQQLPPNEQDILYLKYQEGYNISEIAEIIGKSENAVKLSLSRIRKKLATHPYLASISGFSDQKRNVRKGRYAKK